MTTGTQMTPGAARVVDPVLTTTARGYRNASHVWPYIFPPVPVEQRGGRIIEFGAEDFLEMDIERAPGADIAEMNVGWSSDDYACRQHALMGKVPIEQVEEGMAVPGINAGMIATDKTLAVVSLQIEIKAAKLITPTTMSGRTEALAGSAQWDHADSLPAAAVTAKRKQIRRGVGRNADCLTVGEDVHDGLINNKDMIDRIKHTNPAVGDVINEEVLAKYFNVKKYVVGMAQKGTKGNFTNIWGNIALLHFSDVTPLASMGSPSFGYTYRLNGYPMVASPYWEERKRSWLYPVITEDTPVLVGKDAGFLWTNVVSNA